MALSTKEKLEGALYGFALGDAWGYVTEFMEHSQIMKLRPGIPKRLVVSDDTQMGLYTLKAVEHLKHRGLSLTDLVHNEELQAEVRVAFSKEYVNFYNDPDNDRAPGLTCMEALGGYALVHAVVRGDEFAVPGSKGCGTIMRTPWLGLLPEEGEVLATLAVLQAQVTHGHPAGWLASAICTLAVHELFTGELQLGGREEPVLLQRAVELLQSLKSLPVLAEVSAHHFATMEDELQEALDEFEAFAYSGENFDMNLFFGEGWTADSSLYNGLAAAGLYSDSPRAGLRRLVYTSGDSDSIAAIGGALLGVAVGVESFGASVAEALEPRYRRELAKAAEFLGSLYPES